MMKIVSLSFLVLLVLTVCSFTLTGTTALPPDPSHRVAPAVLSLDFGSEWFKSALSNRRSNSIGAHIDVVINEQSNRKTPSLLGFDGENDRVTGESAVSLIFRSPNK